MYLLKDYNLNLLYIILSISAGAYALKVNWSSAILFCSSKILRLAVYISKLDGNEKLWIINDCLLSL